MANVQPDFIPLSSAEAILDAQATPQNGQAGPSGLAAADGSGRFKWFASARLFALFHRCLDNYIRAALRGRRSTV